MSATQARRTRAVKVMLGAAATVIMTIGATAPTGCQPTPPADQWHPVASASAVGGVAFGDRDHAWRVGAGGLILASADGGSTWVRQTSPVTEDLVAVDAVNATLAFIAGRDGSVLVTVDGGATWVHRVIGQSGGLRSIDFTDVFHGWVATGTNGVFATSDGGLTWTRQSTPSATSSVVFLDALRGFAGSGPSTVVIKTSDGGRSWAGGPPGGSSVLTAGTFVDRDHGWFVGTQGASLHTTDGGVSWDYVTIAQEDFNGVAFADARHGVAVGTGQFDDHRPFPRVFATSDGGVTWTAETGAPLGDMAGIAHRPGGGYLLAGRGRSIYASVDGQQWVQTDRVDPQASVKLRQLAAPTANDLLAAGDDGTLEVSHDGGRSWTEQPRFAAGDLHAIAAVGTRAWTGGFQVDPQDVYGDDQPTLFRSEDGGATWQSLAFTGLPASGRIEQLRFDDAQHGWLVGSSDGNNFPYLARTDDGGVTWTVVLAPHQSTPFRFDVTGNDVWVVAYGQLFHSPDRGVTWPAPTSTPTARAGNALWSVDFVDQMRGWIGAGTSVFRTTNGGATWTELVAYGPGGQSADQVDVVRFADANHGYGFGARLFETFDGGVTWRSEPGPPVSVFGYPANDLLTVAPDGRAWIVGDQSLVLGSPARLRATVNVTVGATAGVNKRSVAVTVAAADGFGGAPTGQVVFESGGAAVATVSLGWISQATAVVPSGPLVVRYLGDGTFGARPSPGITVTG